MVRQGGSYFTSGGQGPGRVCCPYLTKSKDAAQSQVRGPGWNEEMGPDQGWGLDAASGKTLRAMLHVSTHVILLPKHSK